MWISANTLIFYQLNYAVAERKFLPQSHSLKLLNTQNGKVSLILFQVLQAWSMRGYYGDVIIKRKKV